MEKNRALQWHPGFRAALRITLREEMKYLEMYEEYQLSRKPLQIDILILKKNDKVTIKKSIGKIFRTYNIIEYKSPNDSLSINDFYKVYGYTCFYQSNTDKVMEINPDELTITFVCSHYPDKMLRHLEETRKICVEKQGQGIYYLKGDAIHIQLLIVPQLSDKENYWIQNLRTDLKAGGEIRNLMENYEKNRKSKDHEAVMDLITRANREQMEEEKKMCDALKELFAEELKEADEKGVEKGMAKGMELAKRIFALNAQGLAAEEIAQECGVTTEQVKKLLA